MTANDSQTLQALGATQASVARADVSSATVRAYVEAGDGVCVPPQVPTVSTPMAARGQATSDYYDTYIVSSTTLPDGFPVSVAVPWRVTGSFSAIIPEPAPGSNRGTATFRVTAGPADLSRQFVSSLDTLVNDSGTVMVQTVVGGSVIVTVRLNATVLSNVSSPAPFVANFSGSAVALTTHPGVVVTGVAHSGGLAPVILTPVLPDGAVGQAYGATVAGAYGTTPYLWSLSANSAPLPAGLSLSASGLITGTPTVAGTFPITVQITDASLPSQSDTHTFTLRVFPVSLSAFGTATTIDGILSVGEWDGAACQNIIVNVPGGGTTPARLCVMNDTTNLYVALRFDRTMADAGNSFGMEFDNDNDGQADNGDEAYVFNPAVGFTDIFRTNSPPCPAGVTAASCAFRDVDHGGTNDGSGAFVNNGMVSVYETSHPLTRGDVGHDFALAPGDAVGFWFHLVMSRPGGQFPQDFGVTSYPDTRVYGRIIIAATNAPTPAGGNVVVAPADSTTGQTSVTLTFDQVTQPGTTSVTSSPSGSPPSGFQAGNPPVYYDITTTAVFNGMVTVCVSYAGVSFSGGQPELFHIVNGVPVNVTSSLDTLHEIVCGRVSSLSPFGVFVRKDTTPPVTTATASPGANAGGWNNGNVIVTLSATDEPGGSGVEAVHFSSTGAQTGNQIVSGNAASVTLSADGTTTLAYFAVDHAGNRASAKTFTVRIDKTPPLAACTSVPLKLDKGDDDDDDQDTLAKGVFKVTGSDAVGPLALTIGTYGLINGDTIKLSVKRRSGVIEINQTKKSGVRRFHVGSSDAFILARDGAGNSTKALCPVGR